jgi:hypothetical protein
LHGGAGLGVAFFSCDGTEGSCDGTEGSCDGTEGTNTNGETRCLRSVIVIVVGIMYCVLLYIIMIAL